MCQPCANRAIVCQPCANCVSRTVFQACIVCQVPPVCQPAQGTQYHVTATTMLQITKWHQRAVQGPPQTRHQSNDSSFHHWTKKHWCQSALTMIALLVLEQLSFGTHCLSTASRLGWACFSSSIRTIHLFMGTRQPTTTHCWTVVENLMHAQPNSPKCTEMYRNVCMCSNCVLTVHQPCADRCTVF